MPVYFKNISADIAFGTNPIEKMGGSKLTYSMYGDNIPLVLEEIEDDVVISSERVIDFKSHISNIVCLTENNNLYVSGDSVNSYIFTKVASNVKAFDIYIGSIWYTDNNNDLYGFGSNANGQQGSGNTTKVTIPTKRASNVKKFSCDNSSTWYLTNDGDLYGCGQNSHGQQGSGSHGNNTSPSTADVKTFTKRASNVRDFFVDDYTTWYINNNDELFGCGDNSSYQQGSGDATHVTTFTKRADNVQNVICNGSSVWYLTKDGNLYGCGANAYGQQGDGKSGEGVCVTIFTKRASNVKKAIIGDRTAWYIDNNNDLYGCGNNYNGQQSNGESGSGAYVTTFTKRASDVKDFVTDGYVSWYIDNNDDLYGCGNNQYGAFGNGTTENVITFTKRAENVRYIAGSSTMTIIIDNNNDLYMSGSNNYGAQGSGDTTNVTTLTKRASNVKKAKYSYSCCYTTFDGELYTCGRNIYGQLGIGTVSPNNPHFEKVIINSDPIPLKLKFNVIPENAIISVDNEIIEGNSIDTHYGAQLSYRIEAEGYITYTKEIVMLNNTTLDVELKEAGNLLYACYYNANHNSLLGMAEAYVYAKYPLGDDLNVYTNDDGSIALSEDELSPMATSGFKTYQFKEFNEDDAVINMKMSLSTRTINVTRYPDGDI